jgi:hypothetical protein
MAEQYGIMVEILETFASVVGYLAQVAQANIYFQQRVMRKH